MGLHRKFSIKLKIYITNRLMNFKMKLEILDFPSVHWNLLFAFKKNLQMEDFTPI